MIREEPSFAEYKRRWPDAYRAFHERPGLAGYFLKKSHEWAERPFGSAAHFARVLEVGAGNGMHIQFVRHGFDEYVMTDLDLEPLKGAKLPPGARGVRVEAADATSLPYPDGHFDRVIAAHVLEHLVDPHVVLREWHRVLSPRGILTIVLPCDPGVAWRIGRAVGSRQRFIDVGIDYDYWMSREHVNPINNLVAFIRYYFRDLEEHWLPFHVPSMDVNLFYVVHVRGGAPGAR